jgi:hypothetical protein
VNPSIIKLLKLFYSEHLALIKNNCIFPTLLKIVNGVKQEGILSPFLFNYFINDLIVHISNFNLGLSFNDVLNFGISAFADDIFLLIFSRDFLGIMLDEVSRYGIDYNIKFYPDKSYL